MNPRLCLPLFATALLALAGCSASNNASAPVSSSAVSASAVVSPSPAVATSPATSPAASASQSASPVSTAPTPTVVEVSASPSETSPAPVQTSSSSAFATADAVAAPGTNCGYPSATDTQYVYVSGGSISCSEALSVVNEYNSIDKSTTAGVYGNAMVQGYDCYTNTAVRNLAESRSGLCKNSANGGYIEVRPASVRVIPGYVEEMSNYEVTFTDSTVGSQPAVFKPATAPEGIAAAPHCAIGDQAVRCQMQTSQGYISVLLPQNGTPSVGNTSPQAPMIEQLEAKPLDVGTTLTAYGISCQPRGATSVRCINAGSGFTLSENGVATE